MEISRVHPEPGYLKLKYLPQSGFAYFRPGKRLFTIRLRRIYTLIALLHTTANSLTFKQCLRLRYAGLFATPASRQIINNLSPALSLCPFKRKER